MKEFTLNWTEHILRYASENGVCSGISGICLSSFLNRLLEAEQQEKYVYYEFEFFKGLEYLSIKRDIWCPFSMGEIIETLEDIKEVIDFEYQVEERGDTWDIALKVRRDYGRQVHLYIITRVRYLYEIPQSPLYKDAMTLRGMEEFNGYNLQDLYNLVVNSIPTSIPGCDYSWYTGYHSVPIETTSGFFERINNNELKEKVNSKEFRLNSLNNLYQVKTGRCKKLVLDGEIINSLVYWRDLIEYRIPVYLYNLGMGKEKGKKVETPILEIKNIVRNTKVELLDEEECQKKVESLNSKKAQTKEIKKI